MSEQETSRYLRLHEIDDAAWGAFIDSQRAATIQRYLLGAALIGVMALVATLILSAHPELP